MRLIHKVSLTVFVLIVVFASTSYVALSKTLIPAFDELEHRSAMEDMRRARNSLGEYARSLDAASIDWGQWDATHAYVLGQNPTFADDNLEADSLDALELNFMALYDTDNTLVWGLAIDIGMTSERGIDEKVIPQQSLVTLQQHDVPDSGINGLIMTSFGPALVSSRAISHSDKTGPIAGTLIVGRMLDDSRIADLSKNAEVQIELSRSKEVSGRRTNGSVFGDTSQEVVDDSRITRQTLHDIHGGAAVVMSVTTPRDVTVLQQRTVQSVFLLIAFLAVVVMVALWITIRQEIVRPIGNLGTRMTQIENDGDLSARVNVSRADEIGDLGRSFDSMLKELEAARRAHVDQSFQAGMAEVAAGALHNVRNSLMPVVNNVAMAQDSAQQLTNDHVPSAISELHKDDVSPDRRTRLLDYLSISCNERNRICSDVVDELRRAQDQINYILEILKEQEQLTGARPIIESVELGAAIDEAIGVIPPTDDIIVEIDAGVREIRVMAHRVGFVQVLGNVLLNAYEAIRRGGIGAGHISVAAARSSSDEVTVSIADTGTGIEPLELDAVFERRFTSKPGNTGGLGLHWSANAIAGMDGRIEAASDGPGQGAELRVTLKAA